MNNDAKNFLIVVLSLIVLIQSVFLAVFLSRRAALKKQVPAAAMTYQDRQKKGVTVLPEEKKGIGAPSAPQVEPRPAVAPPARVLGRIAIVLDDWGYNLRHKDFITENRFEVTLSILPHRAYSTQVAELARAHGKEVMIHMPMEPNHKEQVGLEEKTLLTSMDRKTVVRLLEEARASVPFAAGVNNHMGSAATADARFMRVVFAFLQDNHLFFLDSFVTPESVCRSLSKKFGIRFAQRDIFIDNEDDPEDIRRQMLKLAALARRAGVAVGIGHDRPATIAVLGEMIPRLQGEGYQFVGMSEVVRAGASSEP